MSQVASTGGEYIAGTIATSVDNAAWDLLALNEQWVRLLVLDETGLPQQGKASV
jgi:hypothetical protein